MEKGLYECHGHMLMDGTAYKAAVNRHQNGVDEGAIRENLRALQRAGITYFRDGGDALGVSARAAEIAGEYGIAYATPIFAIHRAGRYGGIVGRAYENMKEFAALVSQVRAQGGTFIKVMLSGLVDFNVYGRLTCPSLPAGEIRELIHIAHEEGFRVMAHVNGPQAVRDALEAGVDSVEHGYYMDEACLMLLKEKRAVWVPTLAPAAAFTRLESFDRKVIARILAMHGENIRLALAAGTLVAAGSDSGAPGVPHGQGLLTERALLLDAAGAYREALSCGLDLAAERIRQGFPGRRL